MLKTTNKSNLKANDLQVAKWWNIAAESSKLYARQPVFREDSQVQAVDLMVEIHVGVIVVACIAFGGEPRSGQDGEIKQVHAAGAVDIA